MSKRQEQAQDLYDRMTEAVNFDGPCNIPPELSRDKRSYDSVMMMAGSLDLAIKFYSEKFILVKWQTSFRDLPHRDGRVFCSPEDAFQFVKLAFADFDFEGAKAINTKD